MAYRELISVILIFLYYVLAVYASSVIAYRKLDPVKSLSWIIVILLLPYIGLFLYLFFGQNFRKTKIYNRKGIRDERFRRLMSYRQMKMFNSKPETLPAELEKFRKLINLNLKGSKSLLGLNSNIEIYFSGKEALDAMYKKHSWGKAAYPFSILHYCRRYFRKQVQRCAHTKGKRRCGSEGDFLMT